MTRLIKYRVKRHQDEVIKYFDYSPIRSHFLRHLINSFVFAEPRAWHSYVHRIRLHTMGRDHFHIRHA